MLQSGQVEVRKTEAFERWLRSVRDFQARARILARVVRLGEGHAGDARSVGGGVMELRIHFGPGIRVYFARIGDRVVLLLGGGDKSTQARDIAAAVAVKQRLDGENDEN